MVTYEDIKKANESIKTTDIKGKDYAEVNQKVKAFRMMHPNGCIRTEIKSLENGICLIVAEVYDADNNLLGTGTAYEKEDSSFINKTSYIENCETSAVGRALAMLGIGIDTSIASAEEVRNAQLQQSENKVVSKVKVDALKKRCESDGVEVGTILKLYKVDSLDKLTEKKYSNINTHWEDIKKSQEK